MRRTDRLFELIQIIRDGRVYRAADLARRLEVSERTIYRDLDTLVASGVHIEGERGVGYMLRSPVTLPPLMFDARELEALELADVLMAGFADEPRIAALKSVLAKIRAVLPDGLQQADPARPWDAPMAGHRASLTMLEPLRQAVIAHHVMQIEYESLSGGLTQRKIRPLNLECWGAVWTCTSWCELRDGFRVFRVDRVRHCSETGDRFELEPGKTLDDYLAQMHGAVEPCPKMTP